MSELRHFKLAGGDEIICEVIEWNDDESDMIVARNILEICYLMNEEGQRMCTMRPWMFQQVQNEYMQTISSSHITADAQATPEAAQSWKETIQFYVNKDIDISEGTDDPFDIEPGSDEEVEALSKILEFIPKNKLH